jgi:uncharacterized protein (DUF305 family)
MYEFSVAYQQIRHRLTGAALVTATALLFAASVLGQSAPATPVVVQPGAPGQPTRALPADTRPSAPSRSAKDVEFMRGMIHHHAQAVEMVDLIDARTSNEEIRRLGERISASQSDEMAFMRRWLTYRGEAVEAKSAAGHDHGSHSHSGGHSAEKPMLMPGMLSPEQMAELKNAKGAEFDRLFLNGMIQHHRGALTMVKELFASPGTGQDAELFSFATDVESGQIAEIKIMQTMLAAKPY